MRVTLAILATAAFLTLPIQAADPHNLVPPPPPSGGPDLVITNGTFSVGIGPDGELYDSNTGTGFKRLSDDYDPLAPGDPRDSWGVAANGGSVWADQAESGDIGVSSSITSTSSTASYTTTTTNQLTVKQNYAFVASNIIAITTTVTNNASTPTPVLFQRDIDWDVYPTETDETSFGPAINGNVIDSSYFGFENPDPTAPYIFTCAAGCNVTSDLGGGIKLSLGTLQPGQSTTFVYLYGINMAGESPADLISQVQGLGAYYYIATESSDPDHTNSAIIAVAQAITAPDAFQVRYVANLDMGDSVINITNDGQSSGGSAFNPGGNLCVGVYSFDPSEELLSCCSCTVTPGGLVSLSARKINSTNLTPEIPSSLVIKLLATSCDTGELAGGLHAWGTTIHALPTTPVSLGLTETPFSTATLSATELAHINQFCEFNQANGTGFGVCSGCSPGGLGAAASK